MSFLSRLFPDDHQLAAEKYTDCESATTRKQRREAERSARRRASHHRGGAARAAHAGQAWEDADRAAEYRRCNP